MSKRETVPPQKTDAAPPGEPAAEGARRPNRQPPWEKEAGGGGGESGSFGEWLRRQREMREISLRDIADRTKISRRYLEAMEADRFDLLPAPIFAKGFLREYARYVGLSPDDVVNHYLSVHHPEQLAGDPKEDTRVRTRPKTVDPGQPPVRRNWSQGLALAVAGLVLLVLIAVLAWFADRKRDEPSPDTQAPPIAAPPPAPVAVPTPAPPPEPRAPIEVVMEFSGECWVDALMDGKTRRAENRFPGEALQLEAQKSIALQLGNAGVVEVLVNDYPMRLDAQQGEVRNLVIDLNTVQALKAESQAPH
ncbi:MAG TPA: helix-turn-helix domain-containing protein [Thermoanaerobaculia bacterium]